VLQAWHIFTRTRTIAMFYLKYKIVRTRDSFHYSMNINLETVQRIPVTKVTCFVELSRVGRCDQGMSFIVSILNQVPPARMPDSTIAR